MCALCICYTSNKIDLRNKKIRNKEGKKEKERGGKKNPKVAQLV